MRWRCHRAAEKLHSILHNVYYMAYTVMVWELLTACLNSDRSHLFNCESFQEKEKGLSFTVMEKQFNSKKQVKYTTEIFTSLFYLNKQYSHKTDRAIVLHILFRTSEVSHTLLVMWRGVWISFRFTWWMSYVILSLEEETLWRLQALCQLFAC